MAVQHFFFKLIPPRPTFAIDMSDSERALMGQHVSYVRTFYDAGAVLTYGPVLTSEGSFGFAVLEMPDVAAAEAFAANDPTILAGLNRYEISPMRLGGAQASRSTQ
ncbi:MAG TPA: YciI family protein [Edaphobacter sp.]